MFQSVTLQNLANFGHMEGHHFEFQSSGDWKSLKLRNGAGAHLSVSDTVQPAAPAARLRARDTADVDVMVTVHRLWPPPHVRHLKSPLSATAVHRWIEDAFSSPLALPLLLHCRSALLSTAPTRSRRCSSPKPPATALITRAPQRLCQPSQRPLPWPLTVICRRSSSATVETPRLVSSPFAWLLNRVQYLTGVLWSTSPPRLAAGSPGFWPVPPPRAMGAPSLFHQLGLGAANFGPWWIGSFILFQEISV
jgi:hypothetical protein